MVEVLTGILSGSHYATNIRYATQLQTLYRCVTVVWNHWILTIQNLNINKKMDVGRNGWHCGKSRASVHCCWSKMLCTGIWGSHDGYEQYSSSFTICKKHWQKPLYPKHIWKLVWNLAFSGKRRETSFGAGRSRTCAYEKSRKRGWHSISRQSTLQLR